MQNSSNFRIVYLTSERTKACECADLIWIAYHAPPNGKCGSVCSYNLENEIAAEANIRRNIIHSNREKRMKCSSGKLNSRGRFGSLTRRVSN